MKDDIRYSEFLFLQALEKPAFDCFNPNDIKQTNAVGLNPNLYREMAITLLEDSYVRFSDDRLQKLVRRLRGEISTNLRGSPDTPQHQWDDPRAALDYILICGSLQTLHITFRGRRRIEELREELKRDRILEDFGVLLSVRYFRRDVQDALQRATDIPVSVLYLDMDDFGKINKESGQTAGDVVMKSYLEVVRESVGDFGTAYRGVGDEVVILIVGQGHERAIEFGEKIRASVAAMECQYKDKKLPSVTVSMGIASTPPESRTMDIETVADQRKLQAKSAGKNKVIAA